MKRQRRRWRRRRQQRASGRARVPWRVGGGALALVARMGSGRAAPPVRLLACSLARHWLNGRPARHMRAARLPPPSRSNESARLRSPPPPLQSQLLSRARARAHARWAARSTVAPLNKQGHLTGSRHRSAEDVRARWRAAHARRISCLREARMFLCCCDRGVDDESFYVRVAVL